MNKIKRIIRSIFQDSKISRNIKFYFIGMAFVMTVAFMAVFILYTRSLMIDAGIKNMNDLSVRCAEDIQHQIEMYINQTRSVVVSITLSQSGQYSGQMTRYDVENVVSSFFKNTESVITGIKWERNAFDGVDNTLKSDPLYANYDGEFNAVFVKENNQVVRKTDYYFDPNIYANVRKDPVPHFLPIQEVIIKGKRIITLPLVVPLINHREQKFLGAFFSYIPVESINIIANRYKEKTKLEMNEVIYDNKFTIVADCQNPKNIGEELAIAYRQESVHPEVFAQPTTQLIDKYGISHHANIVNCGGGTRLCVLFSTYKSNFTSGLGDQIRTFIITAVVLLFLALMTASFMGHKIGEPISQMLKACRQMASGNINFAFNTKIKGNNEIVELFTAFEQMSKNIRKIVYDVKQSAQNVNSAGKELSKSASLMAAGANQQASASEQVYTAMEEMTASIKKNSVNAKETEDITNKVVQSVQIANKSVSTTVEAMKNITDKISIINEIVGRTDLLAVNAAIEAARVGELGKGFAVVASEIRKLAEKSQAAAQEIDTLTANGVRQAENSGKLLQMLVPEINKTSMLVHEITASSVEQNSNAAQVNHALQQLNDITQQNASTAEQLSTSADESQAQAELLDSTMDFFKLADNTSLSEIAELNRQAEAILAKIEMLKQQQHEE